MISSSGSTQLSRTLDLFPIPAKGPDVRTVREDFSHYLRTTQLLSARTTLELPGLAQVRFIHKEEADAWAEVARKRNVYARHSWENNFYLQRIRALSNRTVIQVSRKGDPDEMIPQAKKVAEITEKIGVLSSTLAIPREKLHRLLGIAIHRRSEFDVTIGRRFYYLRSKSRPQPILRGIIVDGQFCKRFQTCGFTQLAGLCLCGSDVAFRVRTAIDWLFESRQEPLLTAAIVKTSIALESLLVFSESEPLTQSLSERAAFILTSDSDQRREVSRALKRFYEARSGLVHGSRKKMRLLTTSLVEGVDRLAVLACLLFASNHHKLDSAESLREWCEGQRWGVPSRLSMPFSKAYLTKAIALCSRKAP